MSDDFGLSKRFPGYEPESEAQQKAMYPNHAHLENEQYAGLIKDYFLCVTKYLNEFYEPSILEQ